MGVSWVICFSAANSVDEPLTSLLTWDVPPPAPTTNNIRSPTLWFDLHPFWYHVTSICLSHISDEGVGAGYGPRSAMKTIGNCFSNWKTHFHNSKFLTGIRTRGLIVFGLAHFLWKMTKRTCTKYVCRRVSDLLQTLGICTVFVLQREKGCNKSLTLLHTYFVHAP